MMTSPSGWRHGRGQRGSGAYMDTPEWETRRRLLRDALGRVDAQGKPLLTPRQARVIVCRFGLEGAPAPLETIGKELGVTRERVRQIEADALGRLARANVIGLDESGFGVVWPTGS